MPRPLTEDTKKKILELYNQGLTDTEISEEIRVSRGAIHRWRMARNLAPNRKPARRQKSCSYRNPLLSGTEDEKKIQFWALLRYYHKRARECGCKLDVDIFLHELRALATGSQSRGYHMAERR